MTGPTLARPRAIDENRRQITVNGPDSIFVKRHMGRAATTTRSSTTTST